MAALLFFRDRWQWFCEAVDRPWGRRLLAAWAAIATWDTFVGQLLPETWAQKIPRLYEAVSIMTGWLPWWAWLVVGALIVAGIAIEYGYRRGATSAVPKKGAVVRDWTIFQAIQHLRRISPLSVASRDAAVLAQLEQAAIDGHLKIWGVRLPMDRQWQPGPHIEIPASYWTEKRLYPGNCLVEQNAREPQTKSRKDHGPHEWDYAELMVASAEVKSLWPVHWPNFPDLDKRDVFRLYELAAYWEFEAPTYPLGERTTKRIEQMYRAIVDHQLRVNHPTMLAVVYAESDRIKGIETAPDHNWPILRDDAMNYARLINEEPAFLFSNRR